MRTGSVSFRWRKWDWSRDAIDLHIAKTPGPAWLAQPGKVQSQFDIYGNMWDNHCIGSDPFIIKIQKAELTTKKMGGCSLLQLV